MRKQNSTFERRTVQFYVLCKRMRIGQITSENHVTAHDTFPRRPKSPKSTFTRKTLRANVQSVLRANVEFNFRGITLRANVKFKKYAGCPLPGYRSREIRPSALIVVYYRTTHAEKLSDHN